MKATGDSKNDLRTCKSQLDESARKVQDVAYALASRVDNTTLTELMLTSRRLERLSQRIEEAEFGDVVPSEDDDS